ncbi:MAG: 50S ribosomal protein L9 [Phycisphaerales bacterium]|nr:50S ribosomal protein L9 [Phycisphaerales bacterium]
MAKSLKLLLTENVDNLGIVGDVVNVRLGYARNFLLPRGLATQPSDELLASLAEKRKAAEKELAELRKQREGIIGKLDGVEITLTRACNDQGQLYGSVTQNDLAEALTGLGFPVRPREVRLPGTIKRIDNYDVHIRYESDLEATVKVYVVPDRELHVDERDEMEFDNEGNLIEKRPEKSHKGEKPDMGAKPQKGEKGDHAEPKSDKSERKTRKRDRGDE